MKGLFVLLAVIAVVAANRCPQEEGVEKLLIHEDCNKFYKCTYGKPVEQDCPFGLNYNPEIEACDWPQNVDCSNRNVLVAKVEQGERVIVAFAPEQPEQEDEECAPEGSDLPEDFEVLENGCPVDPCIHWLLPHEHECNLFYQCDGGVKMLQECSNNLHFNNELQVCDWPSAAGCSRAGSANKHLSGRQALRQFA